MCIYVYVYICIFVYNCIYLVVACCLLVAAGCRMRAAGSWHLAAGNLLRANGCKPSSGQYRCDRAFIVDITKMSMCEQLCVATAAHKQCDDTKDKAHCVILNLVRRLYAIVSKHFEGEQHFELQARNTSTF